MKHVAIIGCGQLARMLALAGWSMGMRFSFLAEPDESDVCVRGLGTVIRRSDEMSPARLYELLGRPDVITVEREQVDTHLLERLAGYCPVRPDPRIIRICQHRGREKSWLQGQGVATAPCRTVESRAELESALTELSLPVIVKSSEQGYDGQNQWRMRNPAERDAWLASATDPGAAVVEQVVPFDREISLLLVRDVEGRVRAWPAVENHHHHGILLTTLAPATGLSRAHEQQIEQITAAIMSDWEYVGVLAIECFVQGDRILVNELAPRVHNSGHWTQQGAATSQFENHLRAITGMALGDTRADDTTAMINLLGVPVPDLADYATHAHVHLYNKQPRPGRKTGHVNIRHADRDVVIAAMQQILALAYEDSKTRNGAGLAA